MNPIPEVLTGSVCEQFVRCGRSNCRCQEAGAVLHGPYSYHFYREGGRLKKRYLRPDEVEATRQACARGREERSRRARYRQAQRTALPRELRELLRDLEARWKSEEHA